MDRPQPDFSTGPGADQGPAAALSAATGVFTALRQAPLGIAIFDRDMRYLAASGRFLTDQGLPGDMPLIGRRHYDVFPEIPQHWRDLHAKALRDEVELSHPAEPFMNRDGQVDWIRWSLTPWRTDDGELGGLILYTEVVTPGVEGRMKLEAAEAQYRAVFDQAPMGVARVSPEGRFLEVNDSFCAITRHSREALLARTFQTITHPDDLEPDLAQVEAMLAGRQETLYAEKRYVAPNGEIVWVNLTSSLVRKPDGAPAYFVSIIYDIGARKHAEAEQQRYQGQLRLLINELNHRVKNTLATVQSMAAQTLRGEPDPVRAYEKFEARLLGLAEVHELLTRERWHGAALQDVAERALKPFATGASGQAAISGPPVRLAPGPALTIAMVLHELATNAVKYGALSVEGGCIDLSWTFDEAASRLAIRWIESGGPPVSPPGRRGFGTRLIERSLKGELKGQVKTAYDPGGLRCELEAFLPPPTGMLSLFEGL